MNSVYVKNGIHKREQLLIFVDAFMKKFGYSPTYRQIGEELNCGISTVARHVKILLDSGRLTTDMSRSAVRNIRVAEGVLKK